MSLFNKGSLLCMIMVCFLQISSAVHKDCSELNCYNGGSLLFENDLCVCRCPPNVTGLLCGQEIKTSMWPPGPYAVPMIGEGCPEDSDRGWLRGRIKITTRYPMTERDSFMGCKDDSYKHQTNASIQFETYVPIAGYFDTYELQMTLYFKMPHYTSNFGTQWPTGNYSIYGINQVCPPEFIAQNLTVCFPQTQTLEQLESLPVYSVSAENDGNHTNLQFTLCTRRPEKKVSESSWNVEYPYSFLKVLDKKCQDIHGYVSSQRTLPSQFQNAKGWSLSEQQIFMFCLYLPENYVIGAKSDYGNYSTDATLRAILKDKESASSLMVLASYLLESRPFDNTPGFPSSYCGKMQKLTIDAETSVGISGILFQFDTVISQYRFRRRKSFLYIFTSNQRIFSSVSGALLCMNNEYSWENSETDLIVVLVCNRSLQGRYVTIYTQEDILSNTSVTILSQATSNLTDTSAVESGVTSCYSDMGMSDLRITDYQLEASTSQIGHEPKQARPHYNGWCAELHDIKPFLQERDIYF